MVRVTRSDSGDRKWSRRPKSRSTDLHEAVSIFMLTELLDTQNYSRQPKGCQVSHFKLIKDKARVELTYPGD